MIRINCFDEFREVPFSGSPVKISDLLSSVGIRHEQPCGGRGKCGKCLVFATGDVSAPTVQERALLAEADIIRGMRMSCCAELVGPDAEIRVSENTDFSGLADIDAMQGTVAPMGKRLGLAVDIGTTAVASYLCNLQTGQVLGSKAIPNAQRTWGADVVSRIEASLAGHKEALAEAVRSCIGNLAKELVAETPYSLSDIDAAVITGNTAMLYMLMGYSVDDIALAPFRAEHLFGEFVSADQLFTDWNPTCRIYLPRCISAYVGADVTCGILSSEMLKTSSAVLLADIGTNGEMALYDGTRLLCCSTAAGPALEGVGIQMGSCAVNGAIDRVWLQDGEIYTQAIGDVPAASICGSGLLDAVSCLLENGSIDESGAIEEDLYLGKTAVKLSQQDIRSVQLAKAAIRAGIDTLLYYSNVSAHRLLLAGGFGSLMNPESAEKIGLLPRVGAESRIALGNAAGRGAVQLLFDQSLVCECERIAELANTIELATDPVFSEAFIDRISFEEDL